MRACLRLLALALAAWGFALFPAEAHMLPDRTVTLNVVNAEVYTAASIPVSALTHWDTDRDGRLSSGEVSRGQPGIASDFAARFRISSGGRAAQPVGTLILASEAGGAGHAVDHVIILQRSRLPAAPETLAVEVDLFGSGPGGGDMTLTAARGQVSEAAVFSPLTRRHVFFRSPVRVFLDNVVAGAAHILRGPDHLVFLLTLLLAGAGWRYWASVTAAFTLAHSLSLSAAALGVVRLDPGLVEPAIGASLVMMAGLNLAGRTPPIGLRLVLVVGCGLLHGLGFASGLGALPLDASTRLSTLAGFNLGVEAGQLVFLGGVLFAGHLLGRRAPPALRAAATPAAAGLALVFGLVLTVERLVSG